MQKIINAHCHIYPEKIADKAVVGIRDFYDLDMSLNGKLDDLIRDGNEVGVTHYLVHSVATTPKQVKSINEFIAESVNSHPDIFTGFGIFREISIILLNWDLKELNCILISSSLPWMRNVHSG